MTVVNSLLCVVFLCTVYFAHGQTLEGTWSSTSKVDCVNGSTYVRWDDNGLNIGVYFNAELSTTEKIYLFFNLDSSMSTEPGSNSYNTLVLPFYADYVAIVQGSNTSDISWENFSSSGSFWLPSPTVQYDYVFSNSSAFELIINDTNFVSDQFSTPKLNFLTIVRVNDSVLWLAPPPSLFSAKPFFGFFQTTTWPANSGSFINAFPFVFQQPGNWSNAANWLYMNQPSGRYFIPTVFLDATPVYYDDDHVIGHLNIGVNVQLDMQNHSLTVGVGGGIASYLAFENGVSIVNNGTLYFQPPMKITAPSGLTVPIKPSLVLQPFLTGVIDGPSTLNLLVQSKLTVSYDVLINVPIQYEDNTELIFEGSGSPRWQFSGEWLMLPRNTAWTHPSIPRKVTAKGIDLGLPGDTQNSDMTYFVKGNMVLNAASLSLGPEAVLKVGGNLYVGSNSLIVGSNARVYAQTIFINGGTFQCQGGQLFQWNSQLNDYETYPPISVNINNGPQISNSVEMHGSIVLVVNGSWASVDWYQEYEGVYNPFIISNQTANITAPGNYSVMSDASDCQTSFYFTVVQASPSPSPSLSPSASASMGASASASPHESVGGAKKSIGTGTVIGISAGVGGAIVVVGAILGLVIWKKKGNSTDLADLELQSSKNSDSDNKEIGLPEIDKRSSKIKSNEIDYSEIKIGKELGRGAFGVVYKAKWRNTDVVVKQMDASNQDEQSVKQFLKETTNVQNARLHPNVCAVFGVCTNPQHPTCIVMEYVGGGSLDNLLYNNTIEVDAKMALQFGKNIAGGMSHLHQENILHCDLAARNLLVSRQDGNIVLKISDFGLSKVTEADSYNASVGSTFPIRWTPPEALRGGKITRAFDVWSFAVVMWEIIEGKKPYPEMSNTEVINQVCDRGYRLPKPQRIEIPDELYQLMLKCWAADPSERPTFNTIYDELENMYQSHYGYDKKDTSGATVNETVYVSAQSYGNVHPENYENATQPTAVYGNES